MDANGYELMVALLDHVDQDLFPACRTVIAEAAARCQRKSTDWNGLRKILNPSGTTNPSEQGSIVARKPSELKQSNPLNFIMKTAAGRLVDSLSAHEEKEISVALDKKILGLLTQMDNRVTRLSQVTGNAGASWETVNLDVASTILPSALRLGQFKVRCPDDIQKCLISSDWGVTIPAMVPVTDASPIVIVGTGASAFSAVSTLQSLAIRSLLVTPPGSTAVHLLDPSRYCASVSAWAQSSDCLCTDMSAIIDRLTKLPCRDGNLSRDRNNNVLLRHVCLIANFPLAFSVEASQIVFSLASASSHLGVQFLIHWSGEYEELLSSSLANTSNNNVLVTLDKNGRWSWMSPRTRSHALTLDTLPFPSVVTRIVSAATAHLGVMQKQSMDKALSSLETSETSLEGSRTSIRVPIGISVVNKEPVWMELGKDLQHHVLLIGSTRSGKTNLMNVLITGLAERYSPDDIKFYLIDFKGGVGFKSYAEERLPHIAVIAIDCDREYGLSVLEAIHATLNHRMKLFRTSAKSGQDDFSSFRGVGHKLERILLVVDEFQQLFAEEDEIASKSRTFLNVLLRQGAGFGIHVFLCTQTVHGAGLHSVPLEQIHIRIAMACSEEDSRAVLGTSNNAASSLKQVGEGIYNPSLGCISNNIHFRAPELKSATRIARVKAIASRYISHTWTGVVFEGNDRIPLDKCDAFAQYANVQMSCLLQADSPVLWLGEPIAVSPPSVVSLTQMRGRNILLITKDAELGTSLLINAMLSLLVQAKPADSSFFVFNSIEDSPVKGILDTIEKSFPHRIERVTPVDLPSILNSINQETHRRFLNPQHISPRLYLILFGLQRFSNLRVENEYAEASPGSPSGDFTALINNGPEHGVHSFMWCDQTSNVKRCGNGIMRECGIRLAGPITSNESQDIFGSTVASKLHNDNRVIVYDDSDDKHASCIQVVRPYAVPEIDIINRIGQMFVTKGHK